MEEEVEQPGTLLNSVLQALPDAVVLFDAAGKVQYANSQAAGLVDREPEALQGLTSGEWRALLRELFPEAREPDFLTGTDDEPEEARSGGIERLCTARYPKLAYAWQYRTLHAADGRRLGWLETFRNETSPAQRETQQKRERDRHRREMEVLRTRLEQVEKFEMELTANVTHDLKTPIASIKASVSGLLAGDVEYDPQEWREALTVIDEEADRLLRRVNNLLSMAKMEAGDALLFRDWVDVTELISSGLESLRAVRGDRPVELDLPEDLPLVWGDYDQLLNALRNLLENAFLYSTPGQPVEISARVTLGQMRLRIRDYGSGLMPDEFERVFDKFYRGRSARRIPGTGLGLPICRGIAEAHGGHLWAEHAQGGGVVFVFSIPVQPEGAEEQLAPPVERD